MRRGLAIAGCILAAIIAFSIASGNLIIQMGIQAAWRVGAP